MYFYLWLSKNGHGKESHQDGQKETESGRAKRHCEGQSASPPDSLTPLCAPFTAPAWLFNTAKICPQDDTIAIPSGFETVPMRDTVLEGGYGQWEEGGKSVSWTLSLAVPVWVPSLPMQSWPQFPHL